MWYSRKQSLLIYCPFLTASEAYGSSEDHHPCRRTQKYPQNRCLVKICDSSETKIRQAQKQFLSEEWATQENLISKRSFCLGAKRNQKKKGGIKIVYRRKRYGLSNEERWLLCSILERQSGRENC
ncbi:hypothetical protein AVEN_153077-1 [Araneus ventricosus]|uniref:Uncharacterized protein n=1 Tax=Araneus ventricosus TaxID=182803 RepID=A0A4Y2E644_ARAVE|nr:hypothetical protein AVEN_153077-1 [Araneus ventricosus]